MAARIGRALLRLVAGTLVVLAAVTALLIWRTAEEPVSVGFLLPVLKPHFAVLPPELSLDVADLVIAWDRLDRSIELRATGVAIRAQKGPALIRFPAVDIDISARALIHGAVALTAVEIKNPSMVVSRHRDGTLTFAGAHLGRDDSGKGLDAAVIRGIAETMLAPEDPSRPLSYLRQVRVSGGSIRIKDAVLQADWRLPLVDLSLIRDANGLIGRAALHVAVADTLARIDAAVSYADVSSADMADAKLHRMFTLSAAFSEVRPSSLAELLRGVDPALAELAALDVPLRGTVTLELNPVAAGAHPIVAFRIEGSAGVLSHRRFPAPLPVRGLRAAGRLDAQRERLELDRAIMIFGSADAPGPTLALSGVAQEQQDAQTFTGTVTLERLDMTESDLYWPQGLARRARAWVTRNIKGGMLDGAAATLRLRVPHAASEKTQVVQADGTLSYRGLEVQYLRAVPSVVGLTGTGVFDRTALRLKAGGGTSQNLRVSDVAVDLTGLDRREKSALIDVDVDGAVSDAMTLLDHPRFNLASKVGIEPSATGGSFAGGLTVTVPLIPGVRFDDVGLRFAGRIEEGSVRDIRAGFRAAKGRLDVDVDLDRARFKGPVEINGVPVQLDWTEAFNADAGFVTKARATARNVDDAARHALGVDLAPFVSGPISVTIDATLARGGTGTLNASVDLTESAVVLPLLNWRKEPGAEGDVETSIALEKDGSSRLTRLRMDAGSLSAEGQGALDRSGKVPGDSPGAGGGWLHLDRLMFAGSALSGVSIRWTDDALAVDVGGGSLDAAPLLREDRDVSGARRLAKMQSVSLTAANLRRVTFANGRFLENVGVRLHRSSAGWEQIHINAQVPAHLASSYGGIAAGPQSLTVRYGPLGGGSYPLLVRVSDTGGLMRALDAVDGIKGGYCEITGRSDGATTGDPMRATLSCQRITDTEASPMGKILNALSISGIRQALAGEGITFDQVRAEIIWHDGTATMVAGEAYNSALGVTLEGRLALESRSIDARGTVIPAYTVNRMIGQIPLIGDLLSEGQGFFAGHFRVSGTLPDPEIKAQPLKSITPSILTRFKNLFSKPVDRSPSTETSPLNGAR